MSYQCIRIVLIIFFSIFSLKAQEITKIISPNGSVFESLGDLPGGEFNSTVSKISSDGKIIVGASVTEFGNQAFFWSEDEGMISLGNLLDSTFIESWANDLSDDGSKIVGYGHTGTFWTDNKGFIWDIENGMNLVESYNDNFPFSANGISSDGKIITGKVDNKPYRCSKEDGLKILDLIEGFPNGNGSAISADGQIILGSCFNDDWSKEQTCIWTEDDGVFPIPILDTDKSHFPNEISRNGKFVVGSRYGKNGSSSAYIWSKEDGMTIINALPGKPTIHPLGVTDDGNIVVGASYNGMTSSEAFIWDKERGTRSLKTVVKDEYELDLSGWHLNNAFEITEDGKYIIGDAKNPEGKTEAYRITLSSITDILDQKKSELICEYILEQNYPNPFNPSTNISYSLKEAGNIKLEIYNSIGEKIKTLVDSFQSANEYSVVWDGKNKLGKEVSSGIYFYRLSAENYSEEKKMLLIK